jgi:hypothetical protein
LEAATNEKAASIVTFEVSRATDKRTGGKKEGK